MARATLSGLWGRVPELETAPALGALSDAHLLERFLLTREEAAFAALLSRHGPMVFSVARRFLTSVQDAEDAFQATFLLLARKGGTIRRRASLASWLHGVARRLAARARAQAARRRDLEKQAADMRPVRAPSPGGTEDLLATLDTALADLPEKYRTVLVICYLEGKSHAEAARLLGCPLATVRTRIVRGRAILRARLSRRGLALSAAGLATFLAAGFAHAVPPSLRTATLRAAVQFATGPGAAAVCSPAVAALVNRGLRDMFRARLATASALLLTLAALGSAGVGAGRNIRTADHPHGPPAVPTTSPSAVQAERNDRETVLIRCRVLDPEGKPVAGARLYMSRRLKNQADTPTGSALARHGQTDSAGRFRLRLPATDLSRGRTVELVAAADGLGLDWLELSGAKDSAERTLRLVKDVPIHGRLVTTEGKPIPGVKPVVAGLMVFDRLDDFLRAYRREARHADEGTGTRRLRLPLNGALHVTATDRDGRFEITGAGAERLVGIEAQADGFADGGASVVTRADLDVKPINESVARAATPGDRDRGRVPVLYGPSFSYVLERSRLLEGTVREAGTRKPVPGATVWTAGAVAKTDGQGHFRLTGLAPAREYGLMVSPPADVPLMSRSTRVSAGSGLEPVPVDVLLDRGVIVSGRVIDKATGKGVPGSVHFSPLPGNRFAAGASGGGYGSTDADGNFRLVTIPGPGVLLAGVAGDETKIEGVPIYPYKVAEFDAADRKRVQFTDALKPSRAFLVAGGMEPLDFSNACKVLDLPENGKPVTCDLLVDPGRRVEVRLEDGDGKPVTGALAAGLSAQAIRAVPLKGPACPVFALDPAQTRQVVFVHASRRLAAAVTLRGDETSPHKIRLEPTALVTGRVLDPEGQPVAGAEVYPRYAGAVGQQIAKITVHQGLGPATDARGRFRLEDVVPGLKVELLGFVKGRRQWTTSPPFPQRPLRPGDSLDLGDIHLKAHGRGG